MAKSDGLPVSSSSEQSVDSLQTGDTFEPLTQSIQTEGHSSNSIQGVFPGEVELSERFVRHEQLGHGGFGSVYRAYDGKLDRFVALKVPHINKAEGDRIHQRVAREATATARLRHPNIVTLFDFIHVGKQSLLVNELIEGETLTQLIGRHPNGCDFRLAAAVVHRIAQAIQHAHDQSVLHRDIKPSNILLDTTTFDGDLPFCPRLTDFGLATIIRPSDAGEHSAAPTETVGTWHYTPPEVISNRKNVHSPQSDIYSLGVVLFEMITGRRPFQAVKLIDLFPKVSSGDFLPPRSIRTDVPRDLEAICLRCMARNPSNRYPSAAALADDLARFLAGDVVLARLPDPSERFFRWLRRNPTPAAICGVSACALVLIVGVIVASNRRLVKLNSQLESINVQLQTALDAKRKTLYEYEQSNYVSDIANASDAIRNAQLRDARTLLSRYDDSQPQAHHRDIEWTHNWSLIARTPRVLWQCDQPLYAFCELDDDHYCVAGAASEIVMVDRHSGLVLRSIPTWQKEINSLVHDVRQRLIWASGDDGSVQAYHVDNFRQTHHVQVFSEELAYDLVFLPELSRLVCLGSSGGLAVIDTMAGKLTSYLETDEHEAKSLTVIDSHRIATCNIGNLVRFYDIADGKLERQAEIHKSEPVNKVSMDPNHPRLWLMAGNWIRILDVDSMEELAADKIPDEPIAIAFNPVDHSVVVAFRGGVFHRYLVDDDSKLHQTDQWVNNGQRIYFSAIDSRSGDFITVGADGKLLLWPKRENFQTQFDAPRHIAGAGKIHDFQFAPDVSSANWPIVFASCDGRLLRLDTQSLEHISICSLVWHNQKSIPIDGERVVVVDDESSNLVVFDTESGTSQTLPIIAARGEVHALAGKWIADVNLVDNRITLANIDDTHRFVELFGRNCHAVCIGLESERVFWADGESVRTRKLDPSAPDFDLATFSRNPSHLQLSPDESMLAVGLSDREVHLWDWRANKPIGPVMMHEGRVQAVAFSPSGKTLMTVDDSATLRFWNLTNGHQVSRTSLGVPEGHSIHRARFAPNGNFVVILSGLNHLTTYRIH
jgi:serine/threonine protein kinase/WD40 repeat protein